VLRAGKRENVIPQRSTKTLNSFRNFSDKEKDEASPLKLFFNGFVECLHSRFAGVKAVLFKDEVRRSNAIDSRDVRTSDFFLFRTSLRSGLSITETCFAKILAK